MKNRFALQSDKFNNFRKKSKKEMAEITSTIVSFNKSISDFDNDKSMANVSVAAKMSLRLGFLTDSIDEIRNRSKSLAINMDGLKTNYEAILASSFRNDKNLKRNDATM